VRAAGNELFKAGVYLSQLAGGGVVRCGAAESAGGRDWQNQFVRGLTTKGVREDAAGCGCGECGDSTG
jgi:hypothetical protein